MASSLLAGAYCAPPDYEALYDQFHPVVFRTTWRLLGPKATREDAEDGTAYIFQQLLPRTEPTPRLGILAEYDGATISAYNGKPVKFQAFLMAKVARYCLGLRETLNRRAGRDLLVIDAPADTAGAYPALTLGAVTDEYPSLVGEGIELLRERLLDGEDTPGRAPVVPLFDAISVNFLAGRSISPTTMRKHFKLDKDDIAVWFSELRDALREATGRRPAARAAEAPEAELPPDQEIEAWFGQLREAAGLAPRQFELGGLMLTADEVTQAADLLEAVSGNRVLPVWQAAGHRLAEAGKYWYLEFAEGVMRAHAELRTEVKRHSEGHFGRVKQALIFGLRELAASQPAETPSAADPWTAFDRALRQLPGVGSDTADDILSIAWLLASA